MKEPIHQTYDEFPSNNAIFSEQFSLQPGRFDIRSILSCYNPKSLTEIENAALMDRQEEKFLVTEEQATEILQTLVPDYHILEIEGRRFMEYETCYFDTNDYETYLQHHNGKLHRYKIRSRTYKVTDESYFEIKKKTNTGKSIKKRIPTVHLATRIESSLQDFIAIWYPHQSTGLIPQILNRYHRVTLVSDDMRERVTMDFNLSYSHEGKSVALPGIVIIEVKTPGKKVLSPMRLLLQSMRIRSTGFSKYCIGISLLCPEVKNNRFKPKLRQIFSMIRTEGGACA